MTTKLRQLFATKDGHAPTTPLNTQASQLNSTIKTKTYEDFGHETAGKHNGNLNSLKNALHATALHIQNIHYRDRQRQAKHQQEVQAKIDSVSQKIKGLEQDIIHNKAKIETLQQDKSELKEQKIEIKKDPSIVGSVGKDTIAGYYISMAILLFLTLYLFIFYSSASFSAFFKTFTPDDGAIHQAMFDARALPLAWEHGVTELIFILLIPFVFLGLGYLIHKFQESKSVIGYIKVSLLVVITFVFDALLAYDITKKIYEVGALNSFSDMPPYSLKMALEDVNFWIIIFAGFIVYLIWGFVFAFFMEAHAELDKVNTRLKAIDAKISSIDADITDLESKNNGIRQSINTEEQEKTRLEGELGKVWYNTTDLLLELANFFQGWLKYVSNSMHQDTAPHQKIYDDYIQQYNKPTVTSNN